MTEKRPESGRRGKPGKENTKECSGHMYVLISVTTYAPAICDHSKSSEH